MAVIERSFGNLLRAIHSGTIDDIAHQGGRSVVVSKSANDELSGSQGGYIVPTEYTDKLLFGLAEKSIIYPRALVIGMGSSETRGPMLDATTLQAAGTTPFFGGLNFSWGVDGTNTLTNSQTEPAFRELTLRAWDLIGYGVMSNQVLADMTPASESRLINTFAAAAAWYADYAFLRGVGAGGSMPLGMLNAPCAYDVSRAGAGTISQADTANMTARMLPMSWGTAIWICSPTALAKVEQITGWNANFSKNDDGLDCAGYLQDRPLFVSEKLPAVGTRGDLIFVDPTLYVIGDRMQVVVDISGQVPGYFQSNRSVYKVWLRMDGKPMLNGQVRLADGATLASSVVVLS